MALQEVTSAFIKRFSTAEGSLFQASRHQCMRYASTEATQETQDLEVTSFLSDTPTSVALAKKFDPLRRARSHGGHLPPSRYQYRPPKYYRGPFHPHQPPKSSDPASREYIPGPFSLPRLQQTYYDTFAPDLMTLAYQHYPPGYVAPQKSERLRRWTGDSPYFKNRPLRGPRGSDVLKLLRKPITFRNVPRLERVTVHSMVSEAMKDSSHLHVAGMVMQAITNVRAEAHAAKKTVSGFGTTAGKYLSVTCALHGENMYHFISKVVDVVMPKIKDFRGVKGSSGDSSGNLAFGFTSENVALFPEVEVNYDMYPPKMIPGCHVIIHTSATNDRDARMLLSSIGIPFYGKLIN